MPRNSGRSSLTITCPIRFSPSERRDARWDLVPPISDRVWVTFSCAIVGLRSAVAGRGAEGSRCRAGAQHGRRGHVLDRKPAPGGDFLRALQALQGGHRRVHDVDRVRGAERAGQHVVHARAFQYGAHRAAGDDAGTGAGRLQQHHARRLLTLHGVRDRAGDPGYPEERLLGRLDALGDGRGDLLRLAVAHADHAIAVTDDDQGGEAEPPATLDDLGHPVDGDDPLQVSGALVGTAAAAVVTAVTPLTTAAATPRSSCHQMFLLSYVSTLMGLTLTVPFPKFAL